MDNKVVTYIAELDADVDDVVAAHYLFNRGVLKEVVCDPVPTSYKGKERLKMLKDLGIKVSNKLIQIINKKPKKSLRKLLKPTVFFLRQEH